MKLEQARRCWMAAQGLGAKQSRGQALGEVVARTGWLRALGGAAPYLALSARAGARVADVHAAIEKGELRVVPAVRGCMYIVPADDVPLAMAVAQQLSAKRNARDQEKAGIEAGELEALGEKVLAALAQGPQSTAGLRKVLPEGAVRSLGALGKKVGLSSTLPPALRQLEFAGKIRRNPEGNRVDHERYEWVVATESLAAVDDVAEQLCRRYLRWAGPGTLEGFVAWSGLGKRDAKAALGALQAGGEIEAVDVEQVGEAWVFTDAQRESAATAECWLGVLDNLLALPVTPRAFAKAEHHGIPMGIFSSKKVATIGDTKQPFERVVLRDGRLVGFFAYDPDGDVVGRGFAGETVGDDAERQRVQGIFEALGHGRTMILDKEAKLRERLERVRALS